MVIVRSMSLRKADGPLTVQLPSPGDDRPSWLGVGAIAVVGFVIGVAWPRLAGVRLGPSLPDATSATAADSSASAVGSHAGAAPAVPAALPATVAAPAPAPPHAAVGSGGPRIAVAHGAVFACKTASGDILKGGECGALSGLDALVLPRLRKLADCPEAASTNGKLHLVVRADFGRDVLAVDLGRDRGVSTAEPLLVCAKGALASASLGGIAHDNLRYSVAYVVTFGATPASAGSPASPAPNAPAAEADGTAQVEWEVAIVRDAPRTGKVLARLQRGTALRVGASKDGWYPVKFGDGFASDGWVYRGAIGR